MLDEDGVPLAGNAILAAASRAGLTRVRIIDADGTELVAVRRSELTDQRRRELALYDNRASELADWDAVARSGLADEIHLSALWATDELADLLSKQA